MSEYSNKSQINKSAAVTGPVSQQRKNGSAFQFVDNRPEAIAQRKMQDVINNSAPVQQLKAYQETADNAITRVVQQKEKLGNEIPQPVQKKINNTGLPDNLKAGVENLSGMSMGDVKVHYNSPKPAQLQAHAYAQGTDIHIASGQEKHLPHEAWHVVQQKQGRVKATMQMKSGININDNKGLEKEADMMGENALKNGEIVIQNKEERQSPQKNNDRINVANSSIIQQKKDLPGGARILESEDTKTKRAELQKHIEIFQKRNDTEKVTKLTNMMNSKHPELKDDEVLFESVMPPQSPSVAYALWAHSSGGPYFLFPTNYVDKTTEQNAKLANGKFQFVITTEHPTEVLVGQEGHDSIAKSNPVWYAGTVKFSDGILEEWNNDTGHYKTTPEYSHQTQKVLSDDLGGGLLPLAKFHEFNPPEKK
jgi:hypothetical protein